MYVRLYVLQYVLCVNCYYYERERKREGERKRERDKEKERKREREKEGERKRERVREIDR